MVKHEDIVFRFAVQDDVEIYFTWVNDSLVRSNSFVKDEILYEDHVNWFTRRVNSPDYSMYFFTEKNGTPLGQVRIEQENDEQIIDVSVDKKYRGFALGKHLIQTATNDFLKRHPNKKILAYIKIENKASLTSFINAGFISLGLVNNNGNQVYKLFRSI